jgi:hypothetical protein
MSILHLTIRELELNSLPGWGCNPCGTEVKNIVIESILIIMIPAKTTLGKAFQGLLKTGK